MRYIKFTILRLAGALMGRPTDAEIVARVQRSTSKVTVDDVGAALSLRWGPFCPSMEAMPPLDLVHPFWRFVARDALQMNDLPADQEAVDEVLEAWFMAAIVNQLNQTGRTPSFLRISEKPSRFAN